MSDTPEELLPPYDGIKLADVSLVRSASDAAEALAALTSADVVGFDTESKPTFQKGEASTGPHLVQLATEDRAWLFQTGQVVPPAVLDVLKRVLEAETILKVGFGLADDMRRLRSKLGLEPRNVLDLATALRRGERNTIGARTAVARYFGQRLQKSKRITTTNWALPRLSEKQILYAADDAHVALKIYRRWREQQG
jgi:RNA polymerase sigma factor for flagellar operon FliA